MAVLERHPGCAADVDCMGPADPYWTFLETPLRLLWLHGFAAVMLGLGAFLLLQALRRTGRIPMTGRKASATAAALGVIAFVLVAALVPLDLTY